MLELQEQACTMQWGGIWGRQLCTEFVFVCINDCIQTGKFFFSFVFQTIERFDAFYGIMYRAL